MGKVIFLFLLLEILLWVHKCQGSRLPHGSHEDLINIISIVDISSIFYCFVKLHSIISSTSSKHLLKFYFLSLDDSNQTNLYIQQFFLNCSFYSYHLRYEIVSWSTVPFSQQDLTLSGFDTWTIYSRIYLPVIFPVDKYLYLDNDIVVNGDILELYQTKLMLKSPNTLLPPSKQISNSFQITNSRTIPIIGFVFEVNAAYGGYINSHFNHSHPFVRKVLEHNHPEIFFNGGVALVNALQWRKENFTSCAEKILLENTQHPGSLYNSKAVGDQGLFYLLLDGRTAYLPPKFNMRRLPNKTVKFLSQNELGNSSVQISIIIDSSFSSTGIVHFAGTTHGKSSLLCDKPLTYPHLATGAVPLFLSVVFSLHSSCPISHKFIPTSCWNAIKVVQHAVSFGNMTVRYNPGRGKFIWPPNDP
jgi:lipopolysaccharide biosynthesis glycosyltransferase